MSSQNPSSDLRDLERTLYRYGISLAVLFDILVEKGIASRQEIQECAQALHRQLLLSDEMDDPSWMPPI